MEFLSLFLGDMELGNMEAVPGYWIRWQTAICALVIVVPAVAAAVVVAWARAEPLRAFDLWVPCWAWMHPAWILAYRGLVSLGMLWLLWQMILIHGLVEFYFYTQWTFALVVVYFLIGTIMSAHGCWIYSKTPILHDKEANRVNDTVEQNDSVTLPFTTKKNMNVVRLQRYYELQAEGNRAGFLGYTMQLVYQTSAGAVLLTDLVFWGFLVPYSSSEHFSVNAIEICLHALNAVFLLIDTFLNNLPFPWFRMAYFVFWSCTYVTFQWILHASGFSWWPYPFLELDTPWSPIWYLSMALVHVPCYGLYWLIVGAKNSLCPKYFPNSFIKLSELLGHPTLAFLRREVISFAPKQLNVINRSICLLLRPSLRSHRLRQAPTRFEPQEDAHDNHGTLGRQREGIPRKREQRRDPGARSFRRRRTQQETECASGVCTCGEGEGAGCRWNSASLDGGGS